MMIKESNNIYRIVFILGVICFVFGKNALSKEDLSVDNSLRPKVNFDTGNIKDPFHNYLISGEQANLVVNVQKEKEVLLNTANFLVQGVIWETANPCAIINNKVWREKDVIEGAKIVKIEKDGIELLFKGRIYTLSSPANLKSSEKNNEGGSHE